MFFLGNASGHDFQFHLASWLDVASQWRQGILYPRWAAWANWGYGEPRFVFYPPASWTLGAALGSIVGWRAAPGTYIWLTLIAGGMAMWRLAREWLSPREAIAAAVFFAVNPYNLLVVYYRSDFAELLAEALFPLLILGALRVTRNRWRGVPFLGFVLAAVWLCNAPAAVIATYSLALLLIVGSTFTRNVRPLIAGTAAIAMGFGLAAFYILPATAEQRWVQIAQVVSQNLRPEHNFVFAHGGDPEFILFNWKVSTLALGMMLITGIFAVFVARRRREFPALWWMLLAIAAVSSFLMFAPSQVLWRLLPKLRFVQFPWRWLDALSVAFAFLAAAALGRSRKQWISWFAILAVLGATATAIAHDTWWDSADAPTLADWIHSGFGYEGTDEYAPSGCDRYELPGVTPNSDDPPSQPIPQFSKVDPDSDEIVPAAGMRVHIDRWAPEQRAFSTKSAAPVDLALRLVNYPAWDAHIDGQQTTIGSRPETAQMVLAIPAGAHKIDLSLRRTPDRSAGDAISVLSALLLIAFTRFRRGKPA
jgi:hypothetical protein